VAVDCASAYAARETHQAGTVSDDTSAEGETRFARNPQPGFS